MYAVRLHKKIVYLVLLTLLMMTMSITVVQKPKAQASGSDGFDTLRERWFQMLTGGDSLDLNNPDIASQVNATGRYAKSAWGSMNKAADRTYLWSEAPNNSQTSYLTTTYGKLVTMAMGYATYGSSVYHNADMLADLVSGLDWLDAHWYGTSMTVPTGPSSFYNNWWDYEIGVPGYLNNIMVLLYPQLTDDEIARYTGAINHYVQDCHYLGMSTSFKSVSTGANLVWKCEAQALEGILSKNSDMVDAARSNVAPVLEYAVTGDGFHTDGSFIQHNVFAYNGAYGLALINEFTRVVYLLSGSQWALDSDPNYSNLFHWMYDSYEPLMYHGALADMVRGREISRPSSDVSKSVGLVGTAAVLAEFAPPADSARLKSFVKQVVADAYPGQPYSASIFYLEKVDNILHDPSVAPRGGLTLSKIFQDMDRVMHQRPDYAFGISMFSNRIANYESINQENFKGWYTGYGMTPLYTANDPHPYSDNYWPTVDSYRLPGTTVEAVPRANGANQGKTSTSNWAGGATLGNYSAAGMKLQDVFSPLTALKSWFMFDHEVVALGSGITDSNANPVETTIDNRQISGSETLTVDGVAKPSTNGWSETMPNVSWMHLSDKNIGYYFPEGETVTALREARTGSWKDINNSYSATPITRNYMTMLINHGTAPQDSTYSYVVLPNATSSQVEQYAGHPDISILANTESVQAVKQNSLNMIGANFWKDEPTTVQVDGKDFLTSDKKASVMTQLSDYGVQVAVSDPTQANMSVGNGGIDDSAQNYDQVYQKSSNLYTIETGGGFKRSGTGEAYLVYKLSSIKNFTATVRYDYHTSYDPLPILQRVNVYVSNDGVTYTKFPIKIADPNYVPTNGYGLNEKVDLVPDAPIPANINYIKMEYVGNADPKGWSPQLYHMHIDGGSPDDGYINLEINKGAEYVGSLDPNITVEQLYPTIKLRVKVDGTRGRSLQASFYGKPPVTTATLSPGLNDKGWTNQDTTVSLAAQDEPGGSGVASVTYSSSGGQLIPLTTVDGSKISFTINQEGKSTVTYYATDHAGDQEQPQTVQVNLDKTAPTLVLTGTGEYTVDQTVSVGCKASDALSGLASNPCGSPLVSGPAYSFGLGAHTVTAAVYDNAGNGTTVSGTYQVKVTFDSLANLTKQIVVSGGASGAVGIAESMNANLYNAKAAAQRGDVGAARDMIAAYENEVTAQSGKAITQEQANILLSLAIALSEQTQ